MRPPRGGSGRPGRSQGASCRASPYEVLGLAPGASRREAGKAYRALMKENHPDVPGGSEAKAKEINTAYEQLLSGAWEALGEGEAAAADDLDAWGSWSGASLAPGDPTELWECPFDREAYWLTPGQAREMEEMADRGWADECFVMLQEFRYRNDRWWGAREKKRRERGEA